MTIQDFDWVYFWQTANYVSWYEYLALVCFTGAWWFSIRNSIKTTLFAGKSSIFLWLIIVACCLGVCHHLFVDLNFKILFYIVGLCGSVSDYCVCRRLRLEQSIKERKQAIVGSGDRDWSYGSDSYDKSRSSKHTHSHRRSSHRRLNSCTERSEREKNDVVRSNLNEIKFDDITE